MIPHPHQCPTCTALPVPEEIGCTKCRVRDPHTGEVDYAASEALIQEWIMVRILEGLTART